MKSQINPANVLALAPMAGRGTRLGATGSKEIVSLESAGGDHATVLCEVMLQRMCEAGLREAVLSVASHKQDVRNYLGEQFVAPSGEVLRLSYVTADNSPNTPTSIDAGFDQLRGRVCALGFADVLYQPCAGYARALAWLERTGADVVLGLFPTSQPTITDMVAFNAEGVVREIFIKHPDGGRYAYTWSLAVWQPKFSEFMHDWLRGGGAAAQSGAELFVGDAVIAAQAAGLSVAAVVVSTQASLDAGTPAALAQARSVEWGPHHRASSPVTPPQTSNKSAAANSISSPRRPPLT